MRVLILGSDGYLGWPTAMHFSARGHDVFAVDNYLRRNLCRKHDVEPLFEPPNLVQRARLWKEVSGKEIHVRIGDCCDYGFLCRLFDEFQPEAVVHYAEQPSAPYSMIDQQAASLTVVNNLQTTLNVAYAVHEKAPDCHIVKIGTMGEYGTPDIDIEEGWIEIEHKGRKDKFMFPRQASSLYHTTKIQDTDLLWFYVRTWGLRVTDLMQGPVYGIVTDEMAQHEDLGTYFNYDELFGTLLNRFVVQAVAGYPLTVYGEGGQTRGYINLVDTLSCVELSATKPAEIGELRILNQFVELFSVNEIARHVAEIGKERGHEVNIRKIENPRVEKSEHYYNPVHTGLAGLGLKAHMLTKEVLHDFFAVVEKHRKKIHTDKILLGVSWKH
jgi:UDP-sulfoquinovose synthase